MPEEKKDAKKKESLKEKISSMRSTVRARNKKETVSTQRYLPIAEIRNDTVYLKNGGVRAILEVQSMNFNLKSETEQKSIIAGYGAFVNTLTFPLQVVVRSSKTDIDLYIEKTEKLAGKHTNELLKNQTLAYTHFIRELIDVGEIMQKHFYVILPFDHQISKNSLFTSFFSWMNTSDTLSKVGLRSRTASKYTSQLNERIELIKTGLENIGLPARKLNTRELIDLFYHILNPGTSKQQKIPADTSDLNIDKTVL
jgi:hypothetical protein